MTNLYVFDLFPLKVALCQNISNNHQKNYIYDLTKVDIDLFETKFDAINSISMHEPCVVF